eukprot:CAMPEP_0170550580 /NCGR_PEP_ID=MMETSP0211-20121228/8629_1 /TAXON_ID=311385 /ORGANISM="Pseudokeronopsis sp., Strain OXSARD2" /LENGTH=286 /DNA_ID=CAMNT_0010857209 /DNA_START=391 /DNA_END=1251 /DNA_ORIENTATION=+
MNGVARKAEAVTDPRQARIENVAEVPAGVEVGDCEGVLGWARSPDLIPPALKFKKQQPNNNVEESSQINGASENFIEETIEERNPFQEAQQTFANNLKASEIKIGVIPNAKAGGRNDVKLNQPLNTQKTQKAAPKELEDLAPSNIMRSASGFGLVEQSTDVGHQMHFKNKFNENKKTKEQSLYIGSDKKKSRNAASNMGISNSKSTNDLGKSGSQVNALDQKAEAIFWHQIPKASSTASKSLKLVSVRGEQDPAEPEPPEAFYHRGQAPCKQVGNPHPYPDLAGAR